MIKEIKKDKDSFKENLPNSTRIQRMVFIFSLLICFFTFISLFAIPIYFIFKISTTNPPHIQNQVQEVTVTTTVSPITPSPTTTTIKQVGTNVRLVEEDGFYLVGYWGDSEIVRQKLNIEHGLLEIRLETYPNGSSILFTLDMVPIGCEDGETTKGQEDCNTAFTSAYNDLKSAGGIWEFNQESKKLSHLYKIPLPSEQEGFYNIKKLTSLNPTYSLFYLTHSNSELREITEYYILNISSGSVEKIGEKAITSSSNIHQETIHKINFYNQSIPSTLIVTGKHDSHLGTYIFEDGEGEGILVDPHNIYNFSDEYIIFSLIALVTDCYEDDNGPEACKEYFNMLESDYYKNGGIWSFNLSTREFKKIIAPNKLDQYINLLDGLEGTNYIVYSISDKIFLFDFTSSKSKEVVF